MTQASNLRFSLLFLSFFSLLASTLAHPTVHKSLQSRATTCNGDSALCDRLYSNVTYIGSHNSYAIESTSNAAANQEQSITTQLNDGIRMLQVQAHNSTNSTVSGSGIDLCHTSCDLFQGGSLEYYLGQVKSWVDDNPNEVLTLLIVNSDGLPPSQFAQAFTSTGLDSKAYVPADASQTGRYNWPTLGNIIDGGKTVVTFITNTEADSTYNYLLPEFSYIWENPYDQTTAPFNCSVDRIGSGLDSSNLMFLSNHFLDKSAELFGVSFVTPDIDQLNTTNSAQSIENGCPGPTFVLVDYYDYGSVFQAAASMNGVSYNAKAIGNQTSGSSKEGSGDTSSALSTLTTASTSVLFTSITLLGAVCLL